MAEYWTVDPVVAGSTPVRHPAKKPNGYYPAGFLFCLPHENGGRLSGDRILRAIKYPHYNLKRFIAWIMSGRAIIRTTPNKM